MTEYSTRQVSAIVGWPDRRVRYWARTGLIASQRFAGARYRYSFQDIVTLRTLRALVAERVTPRRVGRVIRALTAQLPAGRPPSSVHLLAEGTRILARDALATWEPENGQTLLDFEAPSRERSVSELPGTLSVPRTATMAADWFQRGMEAEEAGRLEEAEHAYANACAADASHAHSRINLGRLRHCAGELREAHRLYREALAIAPDDATAWFNLGVVLEDGGDLPNALTSYRRAIDRDPELADAHYNIARLYQQRGDLAAAGHHYSQYKRLKRCD